MGDAKIRVLALVPDAFGGYGGVALYLSDLLAATASNDVVKEVVMLARNPVPGDAALPEKITVCAVRGGKAGLVLGLFKRLAYDRDFDLVLCGHINFLPLAIAAKLFTRAKLLLMIYGIDAWTSPDSRLGRWSIKQKMKVVSISEHTRALFCGWSAIPASDVAILPNAIRVENYGIAEPDEALKTRYGIEGNRVLLTLGRLSAQERYKGVDEIIDVLPDLLRQYPDLVYVVAGDGDDRERLMQLAADRVLTNSVRFVGRIDENEKAAHFQMADAFAMPGRGEGFGFVFLEAMACGLPVVASKLDGSREAVRNGAIGLMVNPDNREELVGTIAHALDLPKQIPDGLEHFAFAQFEKKLAAIYGSMGLGRS